MEQQRPSLTARAAGAVGRWVWSHRRAWAPTALALVLWLLTGITHLIRPGLAWFLAPLALVPLAAWGWAWVKRPTRSRSALRRRGALAGAGVLAAGWPVAAIWIGPAHPALTTTWLLLTAAGQGAWLLLRPALPAAPSIPPVEETG
ncbi:hypothetical protein ACN20G_16635 [Streptomyces sp. BI20]|uniref:hypothetical protein n=1 Tax=Streptomyces sp. BI20 TaxID=3403460 RepID=UPI003C72877F